jgi:hypothetical protein
MAFEAAIRSAPLDPNALRDLGARERPPTGVVSGRLRRLGSATKGYVVAKRWLPGVSVLLVALVFTSCAGADTSPSRTGPLTKAERLYGLAPDAHPHVTYEPDVVVVGGGAKSVRAANADGLTWTLDPSAPHVGDLSLGKVMVLTNESTGRIISMSHTTAGVVVTLAPVPLGEVFKDATFSWNIPISPDQIGFELAPEPGGNISTPAAGSVGFASGGQPSPSAAAPAAVTECGCAGRRLRRNSRRPGEPRGRKERVQC